MTSEPHSINTADKRSKAKTFGILVNGEHTDIALTNFPNYQNLIITQFEKIGNIYKVKIDPSENGIAVCEPIYTITSLLGAENIQAEVAVRYLAEKLEIKKLLLVCLSLKDYSKLSLDTIIESILENS